MLPGEIYRYAEFYVTGAGELASKYLLVLATPAGSDVVVRLLTSRAHGRPEAPPCYHGKPYGGYFVGILGKPLVQKSWVDLRYLDDLDPEDFRQFEAAGRLSQVAQLPNELLREIVLCVAGADDTTKQQERCLRDTLDTMR